MSAARNDLFVMIAITVQIAFLILRRRPRDPWWRIGAAYGVLLLLTNPVIWADSFTAVPRAMLPLTFAFNTLVPRSRLGIALLVAGNLTVVTAPAAFAVASPERDSLAPAIAAEYVSGFHGAETLGTRKWRWASGSARLRLHNSGTTPMHASLRFNMESVTDRAVTVEAVEVRQMIRLQGRSRLHVTIGPLLIPPGRTTIKLNTNEAPWVELGHGGRPLTFSLENLAIIPLRP
jgi:hypothetical protein